jgi:hypothetical protein
MAEEGLELQRKPWKVWMSSAPQPTAVLTTAYDLLKQGGSKLDHNLVILNENVYAASVFNGNFEQFYRYALDISPATFDKRSKTRVETVDLKETLGIDASFTQSESEIEFYVQDKAAALYPTDIKTVFAVNSTWKAYFRNVSILANRDVTTSYRVDEMFTASVDTDTNPSTSDIYVRDTDEVFTATMVFEDGKKAYTTVGVNRTERILQLILGAILFNSNKSQNLVALRDYLAGITKAQRENLFSLLVNAKIGDKPLLSYVYLWVKAPFCADYIDPEDFNQDLNQDADVTHRNLLLANNYNNVRNNYNRYNEDIDYSGSTSSDMLEKMSRPYCPMTSPMKDILSEKLMLLSGVSGSSIREKAQKLLEDSLKDDSIIGSVLVTPKGTDATDVARFTPFTFYDPESREEVEFYNELGKLPTLIGRDGNLTTDGRIMSPTIDELWYIIYKTILGHSNEGSDFVSFPQSNNYGSGDTSLFEATKEYKWTDDEAGNVKGSPLSFLFKTNDNGEVNGIAVDEWVANPDEHFINVHSQIQRISTDITKFFDAQNPDIAKSRDIFNTGDDIALGNAQTHTKDTITAKDREYGPRSVPLSLRELEAAIMGIKYNVDNNFIFDSKTYAVTGKFGKIEKDDNGAIIAGGSLYQMHRDYNANVTSPNTVFKMGADNTGDNGRDATFGDLNNQKEYHKDHTKVYLLDKKNKRTKNEKTSGMPLLVENYGKSASLAREQGEYTGSDVYMAADGTWRYKAEHMRTPILRSRY